MNLSNYRYLITNWKKNTIKKNTQLCWFCKLRFVKEKLPVLGYLCDYCIIPFGYLQMW